MGRREEFWGVWADALTLGRLILVIPLGISAFFGEWTATAVLLSGGWWSDFLDGKLARRASQPTMLGTWDMAVDTTVGAGLVAGLALGGHLPIWVGIVGAVLAVAAASWRNLSLAMLLQALGYGPVLWFALQASLVGFTVAVATIVVIALIDWRRLVEWTLPTFFRGLLGRRQE
jgi:phosphatidylglycerophosphate synthase